LNRRFLPIFTDERWSRLCPATPALKNFPFFNAIPAQAQEPPPCARPCSGRQNQLESASTEPPAPPGAFSRDVVRLLPDDAPRLERRRNALAPIRLRKSDLRHPVSRY